MGEEKVRKSGDHKLRPGSDLRANNLPRWRISLLLRRPSNWSHRAVVPVRDQDEDVRSSFERHDVPPQSRPHCLCQQRRYLGDSPCKPKRSSLDSLPQCVSWRSGRGPPLSRAPLLCNARGVQQVRGVLVATEAWAVLLETHTAFSTRRLTRETSRS